MPSTEHGIFLRPPLLTDVTCSLLCKPTTRTNGLQETQRVTQLQPGGGVGYEEDEPEFRGWRASKGAQWVTVLAAKPDPTRDPCGSRQVTYTGCPVLPFRTVAQSAPVYNTNKPKERQAHGRPREPPPHTRTEGPAHKTTRI